MKPLASLSLDLDNQWSYMKIHGDTGWKDFPSYFGVFIPYVLDILDKLKYKITFFIVGKDAALKKNDDFLKLLPERGHEIGNHSYSHEPWFQANSHEEIKRDILKAENAIHRVTGQKPIGFRSPGFSWSHTLFKALMECDYLYDSSILPTFIGPMARIYYFRKSKLSKVDRDRRSDLFGSFKNGMFPLKSYLWKCDIGGSLLEIPITTIPFFKIPFHMSYLLYLSRYSIKLMNIHLKTAMTLCRMTNTGLNFLLHPLDVLTGDQIPELKFFPGMDIVKTQKTELFTMVLKELGNHFTLVNMSVYAKTIMSCDRIRHIRLPASF